MLEVVDVLGPVALPLLDGSRKHEDFDVSVPVASPLPTLVTPPSDGGRMLEVIDVLVPVALPPLDGRRKALIFSCDDFNVELFN